MPVATATKISALSEDLGSQRRVAELLGVSPAQVTRWRKAGASISSTRRPRSCSARSPLAVLWIDDAAVRDAAALLGLAP